MPRKRRRAKIPTPAWERPRGTIGTRLLGRGFQFYGLVVVLLVVGAALGAIGYGVWANESEKWGRPGSTAIQVEDTRYRLDYFASRLKMYVNQRGGQGVVQPADALSAVSTVSDLLIQEDIVRRFAGELDVTATDDEIMDEIASDLGIAADDEIFDVAFQDQLTRSELSEAGYRQMIEARIFERQLREWFLSEVPESADSVHYRQIVVTEQEKADELVAEIEGGGDFAALAGEDFNIDVGYKDNGGDVGWVPRGVLSSSTEELVFPMEVGEIAIIPSPAGVVVVEMLEKDDNHPVEEDKREPLAVRALADWIDGKRQSLSIVNNLDLNSGDPDKINWAVDRAYRG